MIAKRFVMVIHKAWRTLLWILVFVWVLWGLPKLMQVFRPDTITKIEKMVLRTNFKDCSIVVERDDEASILLTVSSKLNPTITTEISKYMLSELRRFDGGIIYFANTVDRHSNDTYYLTQTQIWSNDDLRRVSRIVAEYCDRMVDTSGRLDNDGIIPTYKCAVPIVRATCTTEKQVNN